jgi:hypothetical protein
MLPLSNRDPSFLFSPQTDELQKNLPGASNAPPTASTDKWHRHVHHINPQ